MAEIKPISIVLVVASIVSSAAHAQTPAYQAPRQRQCNFLGGQAQCGWGCTPRADAVCCGDSAGTIVYRRTVISKPDALTAARATKLSPLPDANSVGQVR